MNELGTTRLGGIRVVLVPTERKGIEPCAQCAFFGACCRTASGNAAVRTLDRKLGVTCVDVLGHYEVRV